MRNKSLPLKVLFTLLVSLQTVTSQEVKLVYRQSFWQMKKGTEEAASPDRTAWRQMDFNDSGWTRAQGSFWYGESGYSGTELGDMRYHYRCVFLRRTFEIADPSQVANLVLNAVCDDGFIAWINGTKVAWSRPPTEDPTINSLAEGAAPEPVEYTRYLITDLEKFVQPGQNVLAIQVFNSAVDSSDLVFDTELLLMPRDTTPPTIVGVEPAAGVVTNLTSIKVTFDEAVTGVDAWDLRVNDIPAAAVKGSGAVYTFTFPQPAYGTVQIAWDMNCGITDVAPPPDAFDPTGPASRWMYDLADATMPLVLVVHPPPGRTVRQLQQVEVTFNQPVTGVDAADLVVKGQPAQGVLPLSSSVYRFEFPAVADGVAALSWAEDHGITDYSRPPKLFVGSSWSYPVDTQAPAPKLVINEFLAENVAGLTDQDGATQDWVEIYNPGTSAVDLEGWSLSDDVKTPGKWVFPAYSLGAGKYAMVFASGKDRRMPDTGGRFHTNFKLRPQGEYLGLFNAEAPRAAVSEFAPEFPEQANDFSYGRVADGTYRYFARPTPGGLNGSSSVTNFVAPVHFSVERGFVTQPFQLSLATETPGATIRYTTNATPPTEVNGEVYTGPITIGRATVLRAAAFKSNMVPARVKTHTYFYRIPPFMRDLPTVSLVTPFSNLWGPTGIMEVNPRNTVNHGLAWERPVSFEFIRAQDGESCQVDCGIRIQGGGYIRSLYDPKGGLPYNKYSFRLYFRGDYGETRLEYPLIPDIPIQSFDTVVLRAGMNDPLNPFIRDELARRLASDTGQVASHGTFVNLYINGSYIGYYNPTERIDEDFLRDWHGGGDQWDQIASMSEIREGDGVAWYELQSFAANKDLSVPANYLQMSRFLDLTNFVDYLCPLIYGDTDDWPHNNWRAAREMTPGGIWRFYVWDAEWSFGYNNSSAHNTIESQLSTLSPPWGSTEIARLFNSLRWVPEFQLLFADRVHKHFFNGGALTDQNIRRRYDELKATMLLSIGSFDDRIGTSWIPTRRLYVTNHFAQAGFLRSSGAPQFVPFGGRVPQDYPLSLGTTAADGVIYFTTNGADPRVTFTDAVAPDAREYTPGKPLVLGQDTLLRARTLAQGQWTALSEANFQVARLGLPVRFTEIMYNPVGGNAYEYLEIQNFGGTALDLSGFTVPEVDYRFLQGAGIAAGERLVLNSDSSPAEFAKRYPGVVTFGQFSGKLDNGGQRLSLVDRAGNTVVSVTYGDGGGWPKAADGDGYSLEILDPNGDLDDPANWRASIKPGGSPGAANPPPPPAAVRLNEVLAWNAGGVIHGATTPDFIEVYNPGATEVDLSKWSLSNDGNARKFVFPSGTKLAGDRPLVIWCDSLTSEPGWHSGFTLADHDGSVFLYDRQTNRVDAISYGSQVADFSVGRAGSQHVWQLGEPSPESANEAAVLGLPSDLRVNEFLANATVGSDDWLELHNRNSLQPAALKGLYLATSNALYQIQSLSFVAPADFLQLRADEKAGPDHVGFKLPATGGVIVLSDPAGGEIQRLTYGRQTEGVSQGLLPDGTGPLTTFVSTPSPGASNYLKDYAGPLLNEVMAWNESAHTNALGRVLDWVEIRNPLDTAFDLSGMSLSLDRRTPGQWVFPAGCAVSGQGFLVLYCDPDRPASTQLEAVLNTGHGLDKDGGGVYLFTATGQLADAMEYGFQVLDRSLGRTESGWALMAQPTPRELNGGEADLGDRRTTRINEWCANPASGSEWFELFNPGDLPVNLGGCFLTDDLSLSGQTNTPIRAFSFVGARQHVKWIADGDREAGPNHAGFALDPWGEPIRLLNANLTLIDTVYLLVQPVVGSQGRFPDGTADQVDFAYSPSPGEANYLPIPHVVVNEVLSHTDPPREDAVEFYNTGDEDIDLSGWFLSNASGDLRKCRIPQGTLLPARQTVVLYERLFNPDPTLPSSFTFNSAHGEAVYLSAADADGNLTDHRIVQPFGAAENRISFGRHATSVGVDFVPMSRHTFGVDSPTSIEEFRNGTGLPNAYPNVGPIVLNEIQYHPIVQVGTNLTEDAQLEFIELHNITDSTVSLFDPDHRTNTWHVDGGIRYVFPEATKISGRGYLLLVNFDPTIDLAAAATFRAKYGVNDDIRLYGPYAGKLANDQDDVVLLKPDAVQMAPHPDAGFVPYLLVDWVRYTDASPWPADADGTGSSLQRRVPGNYGNEPMNWHSTTPTALKPNAPPQVADRDGDGMPDDWEQAWQLNPDSPADAALDADGDGFQNLAEYLSGTGPRNPADFLQLEVLPVLGTGTLLRFEARPECSYTVLVCNDLEAAQWQKLQDVEPATTTHTAEVSDPNPTGQHRFYRLRTPRMP